MIRQDLKDRVIAWADARNFFGPGGATVEGQLAKLLEEASELVTDIVRGRDATDSVGDCLVVLTILERMGIQVSYIDEDPVCQSAYRQAFWFLDSLCSSVLTKGDILGWELIDAAALLHIDPNTALEHALREIEPRRGHWSGGVFVKEAA